MQLDGKVVLITGASQGIGQACSEAFALKGTDLVLVSLPENGFATESNGRSVRFAGDITDPEFRAHVVDGAKERFGRIDVLVNNAGVGLYSGPTEVPLDLAERLFAVNVFAPLALAQLAIPIMREQKRGVIVNVGSVGGFVSLPWAAAYCASKFALHAFSDSLRREVARDGIRVIKVCPGIVDTGFRDHVLAGKAPEGVSSIRRVISPQQVAAALVRGVENGRHTVYVPQIARAFASVDFLAPQVMDWYVRSKW